MSALSPARTVALDCLMGAQEQGRYVREMLDASARLAALDARDAGLARRLALGVTATRGCLDELLDRCLSHPRKVSPRVRMALRIPVFELLYLGRAPEVAVSQGVELTRSTAKGAAGLANAVLRRAAGESGAYLAAMDVPADERALTAKARHAGLPCWLASELAGSLEEEAFEALLACELELAPAAVHVNAARALEVPSAPPGWGEASDLPGCRLLPDVALLAGSGAFQRADCVACDAHAQLVATAATRAGSCLEIGAGRGTKTFVMGCQARRAGLARTPVALDLSGGKLKANAERLGRAGIPRPRFVEGDARDLVRALAALDAEAGEPLLFDTVFVDAPCSGTGTMRRHPEIPWRLAQGDVCAALPALQLELLQQAAGRVVPGGELFYATCSVLARENAQLVAAFLASEEGNGFELAPVARAEVFSRPGFAAAADMVAGHQTGCGLFQTTPKSGGFDGHFCARFIRVL